MRSKRESIRKESVVTLTLYIREESMTQRGKLLEKKYDSGRESIRKESVTQRGNV